MNSNPSRALQILGLGDLSGKGFRAHFSFWSMVAMTFFLFGDQNLTSSNLPRIGADFGMSEEEYLQKLGSHVSVYFFIIGGIMSIVMGMLTDSWNRKYLLIGTVVMGELACFLTAFAPNYTWFLILRTLTGIGLGGIFPIIFSLIGDYFKQENRSAASGWLGLAMGMGILVGQVLGAVLAHREIFGMPGWRASFIIMAAPAFPLALLYLFIGSVPRRGASEAQGHAGTDESHAVTLSDFKKVFKVKTNILAIFQGIPGCVPWGLLFVYTVQFYEQGKGVHVDQATALVGVFGISTILGVFIGGFLGKFLYAKNKNYLPLFCAASIVAGCIPTLYIVNYKRAGTEVTQNSFKTSDLKDGTSYFFRTSAHETGESALSPVVGVKYSEPLAGSPASVRAESRDRAIALSWAEVPGAREYVVQFSRDEEMKPESIKEQSVPDASFVQTDLKNDIIYHYKVCGKLADGTCVYSRQLSIAPAVLAAGVPSAPAIQVENKDVSLTWQSAAQKFTVYQNTKNPLELLLVLIAAFFGGILAPIAGPNIRAIIINTNLPENRGAVLGVFNLADDLGKGLGPYFVGTLILLLPRVLAYNVAVLFWIPCAFFWLFMVKTMIHDENVVNDTLRKRAAA
jgi:MFS family permease